MNAVRIVVLFLVFGTTWILVSDRAIGLFTQDAEMLSTIQSFKGLLFVGLSGLLIYWLVHRAARAQAALEAEAVRQRDHLAGILDVNPAVLYSLRPAPPSGVLTIDFVGHNVEKVTGYSVAQWLSTPDLWKSHLHPEDHERVHQAQRTLMATGSVRHEYRLLHADGQYRWINDSVVVVRDAAGAITNLTGAWLDVTDRRQAEERARLIEQVFESSQEGIFITDERSCILSINRAFTRITGYTLDEALGKTPALLKSGRQDGAFYGAMWAQIHAEGHWDGEIWNRRKSGEVYPEWLTINAIRDDRGHVRQYLGIFTETSSRKAAEERILRLANYDALTDLPNRTLLADRARVALSTAGRQRTPLTVMHLNVDHFGRINESLGHEVGDQVLREVAQRLLCMLRTDDTVCRLGGDDFILLLPNTSARDAAALSLRLMATVAEPMTVSSHVLRLTASVGVAEYPDNGSDLARLTQAAESAVHQAKREGRNTVRFFSSDLQEQVQDAMLLARDLRWALEREQLVLHYQPKVDALTQRIVGAEALIRWQHPTRGLVPPSRFIPIAEESGLIQEIGTWVIRQALAQTAAWQAAGLPVVPVAVNLSVVQFRHPGLRDILTEALRDSGLPAAMLELELTESVAMEDSTFTITTIAGLKQLGVTLSIDDFGTGYSSLSYLKRFAVDKLKIDQSFVRGLNHDPQDEALVTTVISLARSLGLTTVGEGVETAAQREFLRRNGCNELQGYLFSRPVPAEAFAALLRTSVEVVPGIA
ncbi:putative bifunctional diguanylate cyclase/phosphodiesterase [Sphaerotilus sp.]|uniref:putative bifunctional diguanylate cyclase/phosphodiesterase n=1 Tax=Sphaerotilus sp. TaxID=2093942 RepID=UPI002ACE6255|nr:EAL domain-containing protein [Sphaerotilus sp.]MDZ7856734.1 EAL domain-containing protein [Sphaerotilus sp.]